MTTKWRCTTSVLLGFLLSGCIASAQNQSRIGADFTKERTRLLNNCGSTALSALADCAQVLFTDHPLHIAVGTTAPGNGIGIGAALVEHFTPNESWRLSCNVDGVRSFNGSWRAGAYMNAIYTGSKSIPVGRGRPKHIKDLDTYYLTRPAVAIYSEHISLNQLPYFGLGSASLLSSRRFFGLQENITGTDAMVPIPQLGWLHVSVSGELNRRFVTVQPGSGPPDSSIDTLFSEASAPGLSESPGFTQLGEGVRIHPKFGAHIGLDYLFKFQQFAAGGDGALSFRRLTVDLAHDFPLYSTTESSTAEAGNGPDDCSATLDSEKCPSLSRNREGSITARLLAIYSYVGPGQSVPFYFDPTLGGADINGDTALASYQDERFRAPNLLLLSEKFEHSLYGPLGFSFEADEGKVAISRANVNFTGLEHSISVGLSLRGGGLPQIELRFAWGGHEGTHLHKWINPSLLGSAGRPSLY